MSDKCDTCHGTGFEWIDDGCHYCPKCRSPSPEALREALEDADAQRDRLYDGHQHLAEQLTKTQDMLKSAMTVIESFRPLTTAVRENLSSCPADVVRAYDGIADMVAEGEASAALVRESLENDPDDVILHRRK